MIRPRRLFPDRRGTIIKNAPPKFLLRDDFNDTLAAGAVNGTLATPGGMGTAAQNTRTVTDTNGKISIAGNALRVAAGTANNDGIWWGALTRSAGLMFIVDITWSALEYSKIGFDVNQSGALTANHYYQYSTAFRFSNSTVMGEVAAAQALNYKMAVILRSTGAYLFIKGGTFATWTLLWMDYLENGATVYPVVTSNSASAVMTVQSARVPVTKWLPTPICYDTFTRADAAIGTSESAGPDSQAVSSRAWTGATYTISTNKAINTPSLGGELAAGTLTIGTWYSITATEVDHFYVGSAVGDTFRALAATALDANNKVKPLTTSELFATITDGGTASVLASAELVATARMQTGIVVNLDSATTPANFIIAYIDKVVGAGTTNILLDECVAGTYTNKITVTNATYAANARLVVIRNASECRVLYNNIVVGTVQTMTANTNTKHGLFSTNVANTFNDFLVMPRGINNEYDNLNRFVK